MMPVPPLLRVGDIDIWAVLDGRMTVAQPSGFPSESSPDFHIHADYLRSGRWLIDIGGFVVRSGDRLLLVDAGSGPGTGQAVAPGDSTGLGDADPIVREYAAGATADPVEREQRLRTVMRSEIRTGSFGASLAELGFRPGDITDVVLSHLHFDHIGWVSDGERPYFPNAVVRCEAQDADHFLDPERDDTFYWAMFGAMPTSQRLAPVLDRLETWHEDATIAPGVDARFAPGHTPGSCIFSFVSGDERAMILGDSVHCPHELMDPSFALPHDLDPDRASRSRQMIRDAAEEGDVHLSSPHFPGLRFGRLVRTDRPRSWQFAWDGDAQPMRVGDDR